MTSYDDWKTTPPAETLDDTELPVMGCPNCHHMFLCDEDTPNGTWCDRCERRIRQAITTQCRRADDADRVIREQAS